MFSKMLLFSTIIQLSGAVNLLRQAAVQAKIERDRIKQRMPEAEPVTERRNRLNEAVLLSNTSSPCSSEFIATANEALSRSFTFFCAKYNGKALGKILALLTFIIISILLKILLTEHVNPCG